MISGGGAFMAVAAPLEGLQAFTLDRSAYLPAIFYGARWGVYEHP
jgi:hypothetical protein